jgi:uncharacterized protein (DUF1684 family)
MTPSLQPFAVTPEDHALAVAAHRASRVARLTADDGWLTVIGKTWLSPGAHGVGSGAGCTIALPEGRAPAKLGTITFDGATVWFDREEATEAGRERPPSIELGASGLRLGPFTLQLVRRGADVAIRVRDADAPSRQRFAGIPAYPTDVTWRVVAELRPHATPRVLILEDGDGRPQEYVSPGIATFARGDGKVELEPVYDDDRRRLFVLFADRTSRDETYGAGRFLYAPLPESGHVLLDFNLAFNPPCAFTPYATCPLPPANNRVGVRIEAGEKKPPPY